MSDEHILRIETSSLAWLKGVETPVILPAPEIFFPERFCEFFALPDDRKGSMPYS